MCQVTYIIAIDRNEKSQRNESPGGMVALYWLLVDGSSYDL